MKLDTGGNLWEVGKYMAVCPRCGKEIDYLNGSGNDEDGYINRCPKCNEIITDDEEFDMFMKKNES